MLQLYCLWLSVSRHSRSISVHHILLVRNQTGCLGIPFYIIIHSTCEIVCKVTLEKRKFNQMDRRFTLINNTNQLMNTNYSVTNKAFCFWYLITILKQHSIVFIPIPGYEMREIIDLRLSLRSALFMVSICRFCRI